MTGVAVTGGTLTYGTDKLLTFTPTANFTGAASFTVTVLSGGATETITISLNVDG